MDSWNWLFKKRLGKCFELSTPCNGFGEEGGQDTAAEIAELSTPCNGFQYGSQLCSCASPNLSTPCNGFAGDAGSHSPGLGFWRLSTPCNGFRGRTSAWPPRALNFQLHVIDSRYTGWTYMFARRFHLSTPCNGFFWWEETRDQDGECSFNSM